MSTGPGSEGKGLEFEVRGGPWEVFHALVFYVAVACAVLATAGVARMATGISAVALLFYSILAVFSSPTYLVIVPEEKAVVWERYRFFLPLRRKYLSEDLKEIVVLESGGGPREGDDGRPPGRSLAYSARVYLRWRGGSKRRVFRSEMSGSPEENRTRAYLVAEALAINLGLPVSYSGERRGGRGEG
ncbi:hypothetical protein [Candidatus Solincola tengchongensis]|uniref:hypothetical protein n=1 Tax=Candidatus Solincola tengchongensis TaxID=2900693 RepID=UPI00257ACA43|nr:hypothetical protein [Candidatus Solincola tengchongensis]